MTWQAMMLENGEACTVNIEQAVQLYQTAANLNNPRALCDLANLHTYGRCKFEINYIKAIDYLERAIKLKSPDAMNNKAYMLMEGLGSSVIIMKQKTTFGCYRRRVSWCNS